jgi:hypothetical protein
MKNLCPTIATAPYTVSITIHIDPSLSAAYTTTGPLASGAQTPSTTPPGSRTLLHLHRSSRCGLFAPISGDSNLPIPSSIS